MGKQGELTCVGALKPSAGRKDCWRGRTPEKHRAACLHETRKKKKGNTINSEFWAGEADEQKYQYSPHPLGTGWMMRGMIAESF